MDVTPKIYQDSYPRYIVNGNSNRHYGYHCGGHPYWYAEQTAREMASDYMEVNAKNAKKMGTRYTNIEIAIIPYPGKSDAYYVEDRSTYESPWN